MFSIGNRGEHWKCGSVSRVGPGVQKVSIHSIITRKGGEAPSITDIYLILKDCKGQYNVKVISMVIENRATSYHLDQY